MEAQTTSSITLSWEAPEGLNPQNSTYWVQWTGQDDKNETRNTTDNSFTAERLDPGSSYEFSVWVEEGGVNSSQVTLKATTGEGGSHCLIFLLFVCFLKGGGWQCLRTHTRIWQVL